MRRCLFASVLSLVAILLFGPQLRADGLDTFTFTETFANGSVMLAWQSPPSPTPDVTIADVGFEIFNVNTDVTLDGVPQGTVTDAFAFVKSDAGIGFEFLDLFGFSLSGVDTMYSNGEFNPTFIPGTYAGFDYNNLDLNGGPSSATLSIVATPEPTSILMLCIGFLALAGFLTLKKAVA